MAEISPEELERRFDEVIARIEEGVDFAIKGALYELEANIVDRIFNQNEDINGGKFGGYKSKAYKAFREKLGRPVAEKNLQVFNNLRNSIEVDLSRRAIVFNAEIYVKIADGQEKQMNKIIFESSRGEVEFAIDALNRELTKFTKSILEKN